MDMGTMRYLGGKNRISKNIAPIMLPHLNKGRFYLEPFMGGLGMFEAMANGGATKALLGDLSEPLVAFWQHVQAGGHLPTELSREAYYHIKSHPNKHSHAIQGYAGYFCSYGGKWWGGYASDAKGTDYSAVAKRGATRMTQLLQQATILRASYTFWTPCVNSVKPLVYCDPPYQGTTGYGAHSSGFDHSTFWDTVLQWSDMGATVFVSEYSCPLKRCRVVWEKSVKTTLTKDNYFDRKERLFLIG